MDISQAAYLAVDFIFALARAVITAGYGNLILVAVIKPSVGVIKAQSDLGKAERFSAARAAENDILHFCASERLC